MEGKEITIKVQIFEDDKDLCRVSIPDLEDNEIELIISTLTAELKKRMAD